MYEAFFHLNQRPFAATPRVEQYFPARVTEAARRTLVRCIERAEGMGVLVGASGTGKTLVCQMLSSEFEDTFDVVMLGTTRIDSPRALLQAILFGLELPCRGLPDGDMRLALVDHLTRADAAGMLLVADEAHTLPARVLEEIRLITNITVAGQPRARFIMAGSHLLEEHLASPKLESFSQRAAARCYLEPMDRGETTAYIRAQVAAAGGDARRIFTDAAFESVYRASDGVPRLINQLCDHALLLAHTARQHQLTEREVEEAWSDLQQLPTPWSGASEPSKAGSVIEFGQLHDDEDASELDELVSNDAAEGARQYERAEPATLGLRLASGLDDSEPAIEEPTIAEPARVEPALVEKSAVADRLTSIEVGVQPRRATSVELAHSSNPFAESFVEEEVVVERFSTEHASVWAQMPHVYSSEGRILAELLQPYVQTAKIVGMAETPAWTDTRADADLIVVEDDPVTIAGPRPAPTRAYRQEYSQLFAKLRRG
ncbi:MAG TPA: AAA family ATPase [Pirellulales bacterium]|nr:AAA family ATPase [Pirellulales bacterium]